MRWHMTGCCRRPWWFLSNRNRRVAVWPAAATERRRSRMIMMLSVGTFVFCGWLVVELFYVRRATGVYMKWKKKNRTANEGILFVENVVNDHGSIFRPVHQETDVGIDGHIELVDNETVTNKLVAVQVKSGESYVSSDGTRFSIRVDQEHIDYWCSYLVPVIMVCYSPSRELAAWTPISEYVRHQGYHERTPITQIDVPFHRKFDSKALNEDVAAFANAAVSRRVLIECVDHCLVGNAQQKFQALTILSGHPDSRDSRITAFVARRLLFDGDRSVADEAIRTLAYHVGRARWAWNPNNTDEQAVIRYASDLCRDLTAAECRVLIERIDDEWFGGPDAFGERVFDLLVCCEESHRVMEDIAVSHDLPMQRRIKALYMMYGCDDAELLDDRELADDPCLGDVYRTMYADELKGDAKTKPF